MGSNSASLMPLRTMRTVRSVSPTLSRKRAPMYPLSNRKTSVRLARIASAVM
jgi:hypothetical protein